MRAIRLEMFLNIRLGYLLTRLMKAAMENLQRRRIRSRVWNLLFFPAQGFAMKKSILIVAICLLVASCDGKQPVEEIVAVPDAQLSGNRGQVLSTIDVPGYTYIEVRNNGRNVWLAGTPVEVSV